MAKSDSGGQSARFRRWFRAEKGQLVPRVLAPLFDSMCWRLPLGGGASKRLALTFDDGPDPKTTPRLLDVLARHGVPATFFVIGHRAEQSPHLVEELAAAGHAVGSHGWSHEDPWKIPPRQLIRDFQRTDELLAELLSQPVRWLRPPYGHFTYPLIRWGQRRGASVVLWDTMPPDYQADRTADELERWMLSRTRTRSIVCLHDNSVACPATPAALDRAIPRLRQAGWEFALLSRRHGSAVAAPQGT